LAADPHVAAFHSGEGIVVDKWTAKIDVIGDTREDLIAGLKAVLANLELKGMLGVFSGDDGYTYSADIKKPQASQVT
jgi:hypothetical protein